MRCTDGPSASAAAPTRRSRGSAVRRAARRPPGRPFSAVYSEKTWLPPSGFDVANGLRRDVQRLQDRARCTRPEYVVDARITRIRAGAVIPARDLLAAVDRHREPAGL